MGEDNWEPVATCDYCGMIAACSVAREHEAWHEEHRDKPFKRSLWWYWDQYKIIGKLAWKFQQLSMWLSKGKWKYYK